MREKRDYAALDAAIVKAVGEGVNEFYRLRYTGSIPDLAKPHAKGNEPCRVIDRRLQALSKVGQITFKNGKWIIRSPIAAKDEGK